MNDFLHTAVWDRDFRRRALRDLGLSDFLSRAELVVVDGDDPDMLLAVERTRTWPSEVRNRRYLFVRDGGGWHMLCVPWDVFTARQAVAWTFGKDPHSYGPEVET